MPDRQLSPADAPVEGFEPLQRATSGLCACGCGEPVLGKRRRWASEAHRWKTWDLAHPRQGVLKFSGWTHAQRELSAHLQKRETRKARMLARLEQGEATTWELMALGGAGFSSRLKELRRDGHPISCENRLDFAIYRLEDPE